MSDPQSGERAASPVEPREDQSRRHEIQARFVWGAAAGLAGLLAVVLAGVLIRTVAGNRPIGLDQAWLDFLVGHRSDFLTTITLALNLIGGPIVMTIVLTVVALVLFLVHRRRDAALFAISAVGATLCSQTLKYVIARPRSIDQTVQAGGSSFPSGHTTMAAVVAVILILLVRRWWIWLVAVVWVALMAFSRTYLLVHWLSDTLAGAALGASVVVIVWCGIQILAPPRLPTADRVA